MLWKWKLLGPVQAFRKHQTTTHPHVVSPVPEQAPRAVPAWRVGGWRTSWPLNLVFAGNSTSRRPHQESDPAAVTPEAKCAFRTGFHTALEKGEACRRGQSSSDHCAQATAAAKHAA